MKKSIQFWITSGIALCCLAAVSPTLAEGHTSSQIRSGGISFDIGDIRPILRPFPNITGIFAESTWYFVNQKSLLVPTCSAYGKSHFVFTGRGGLPPTPREALRIEPPLVDLGTPVQKQENHASAKEATNSTSPAPTQIVEAQGWVTNAKGEVVLTANPPTVTPQIPWMTPNVCHGSYRR